MDKISEERLKLICPKVAELVRELALRLNFEIRVVQGLRSWNEQQKIWEQGRELINGIWTVTGKIVTKCLPGHSWHNFGMAVDVAPDNLELVGYQPDWNGTHPQWKEIELAAEKLGFTCGADFRTFPDKPHLQLTGKFPVNPNDEVRQIFADKGMEEIWAESGL